MCLLRSERSRSMCSVRPTTFSVAVFLCSVAQELTWFRVPSARPESNLEWFLFCLLFTSLHFKQNTFQSGIKWSAIAMLYINIHMWSVAKALAPLLTSLAETSIISFGMSRWAVICSWPVKRSSAIKCFLSLTTFIDLPHVCILCTSWYITTSFCLV